MDSGDKRAFPQSVHDPPAHQGRVKVLWTLYRRRVGACHTRPCEASLSHTLVPSSHHSRLCKGRQGEIVSRLPSKTMRRVLHRTCLVGGILLGYRPGPCHTPWRCLRASRLSAGRDGEIVVRASFRGGAGAKGAV